MKSIIFSVQLAEMVRKPDFIAVGKKIAKLLEKTGLDFPQKCAAIDIAKMTVVMNTKPEEAKDGAA